MGFSDRLQPAVPLVLNGFEHQRSNAITASIPTVTVGRRVPQRCAQRNPVQNTRNRFSASFCLHHAQPPRKHANYPVQNNQKRLQTSYRARSHTSRFYSNTTLLSRLSQFSHEPAPRSASCNMSSTPSSMKAGSLSGSNRFTSRTSNGLMRP